MSLVDNVTKIILEYDQWWERRDPRLDEFPLMSSPCPTVCACVGYLIFVYLIGPRIMSKVEKPFEVRGILLIYNTVQVILSSFMFYGGLKAGWGGDYSFRCQPVNYSDEDTQAILMVRVCWLYFISKFVEFLDTVFFVLRKKANQITFLHVSHHCMMPLYMWFNVRFLPGGHGSLGGILNTFVHIFMYGYYLFSALGGHHYQKAILWKKSLTIMQLLQFLIIFIHDLQLLFIDCDYPKHQVVFNLGLMVFFFSMFSNYYVKEYFEKSAAKKSIDSRKKAK